MRIVAVPAVALLLSACQSNYTQALPMLLTGPGGYGATVVALNERDREQAKAQQQVDDIRQESLEAYTMFHDVLEETGDPFEARRQVLLKNFPLNPVAKRNIRTLAKLHWWSKGGDSDGAECYMRGFQFGTAHHDQCVYEVKMNEGAPPSTSPAPRSRENRRQPPAVAERFEQGEKVYDPSECIGPVIMGRCKGTILPKKAYHPTCYGTWLNGTCTGPMF